LAALAIANKYKHMKGFLPDGERGLVGLLLGVRVLKDTVLLGFIDLLVAFAWIV